MESCWLHVNILRPPFDVIRAKLVAMMADADEIYGYILPTNDVQFDSGYVALSVQRGSLQTKMAPLPPNV